MIIIIDYYIHHSQSAKEKINFQKESLRIWKWVFPIFIYKYLYKFPKMRNKIREIRLFLLLWLYSNVLCLWCQQTGCCACALCSGVGAGRGSRARWMKRRHRSGGLLFLWWRWRRLCWAAGADQRAAAAARPLRPTTPSTTAWSARRSSISGPEAGWTNWTDSFRNSANTISASTTTSAR